MIGYLLDTHFGGYDAPAPAPDVAAAHVRRLVHEASLAEEAGFDAVLLPDRHARTECVVPDPLTFLGTLAATTTQVTLGTYSLVLPLYHPMHVAEQAALVDLVSEGRLLLTVSLGYHPDYFRQFGLEQFTRAPRFEEGLEILRLAWSGETFSFDGMHHRLEDVRCVPTPRQVGGPPLWIGGESRNAIQRAGRWGQAWAAGIAPLERERWLRKVGHYREAAAAHGKDGHVVLMRDGFVASSFEEAARLAGDAIVAEQQFYFDKFGLAPLSSEFRSGTDYYLERLRDHLVIGSPDDCVAQIQRLQQEFEVDSLVLRMRYPLGPDDGAVDESIGLFGEQVLPRVQGA